MNNKEEIASQPNIQAVINQATQALDRFQEVFRTSSREVYDQVSGNAARFVQGIDTRKPVRLIRRYPIQVTVAAVGLGFILGSLVSRNLD